MHIALLEIQAPQTRLSSPFWFGLIILLELLSLYLDLALVARISLNMSITDNPKIIAWVEHINANRMNRAFHSIWNPITAVSLRFCNCYIAAKPKKKKKNKLRFVLIAELLFLQFILGYYLWVQLFLSLTVLIEDMEGSGLVATWGFGQLLHTFLILLLIFTLIETYAGR